MLEEGSQCDGVGSGGVDCVRERAKWAGARPASCCPWMGLIRALPREDMKEVRKELACSTCARAS